eukprot:7065801-Prymnesium_polylepis.1
MPRQLLVRYDGASATVDDPPRAVAGLKIAVHAKVGVPPGAQVLTFAGRVLDDDRGIDVYGIVDGSTVQLSLRGRGGSPIDIRGMMWYPQWRASVFKMVDQCFDFDAETVELYGVMGDDTHALTTAEEFPCLMQDLHEAYMNDRMGAGEYNKVHQGRVSVEKLEKKLMALEDDEFAIIASCPASKFDE